MKKIVIFLICLIFSYANDKFLDEVNDLAFTKDKGIYIQEYKPVGDSIYILQGYRYTQKGKVAVQLFMTKDKKYIINGNAIDVHTSKEFNIKKDMKKYIKQAHFVYGDKNSKNIYYAIIDPDCGYCKRTVKYIKDLKKLDAKIYFFISPMPMHQGAYDKSYYIISQKSDIDKYNAMVATMADGSNEYKNHTYSQDIKDNIQNLANGMLIDLSVANRPAIFRADGTRIKELEFTEEITK